jgi:mono/diheme cytochrome c family protein
MRFPCKELLSKNIANGGATRAGLSCTLFTLVLILLLLASPATAQAKPDSAIQKTSQKEDPRAARGRYIVDGLARCGQCHTPRDASGKTDQGHLLEGSAVWLMSAEPREDWPLQAPRLAGNPPGTDAEMVTLLTTGVWKNGRHLRGPMPEFRMTTEDAEAVVAYLKSLNPAAR